MFGPDVNPYKPPGPWVGPGHEWVRRGNIGKEEFVQEFKSLKCRGQSRDREHRVV